MVRFEENANPISYQSPSNQPCFIRKGYITRNKVSRQFKFRLILLFLYFQLPIYCKTLLDLERQYKFILINGICSWQVLAFLYIIFEYKNKFCLEYDKTNKKDRMKISILAWWYFSHYFQQMFFKIILSHFGQNSLYF